MRASSRPISPAGRTSGTTATGPRLDEDGQWYLFGRSDDTINVAGKRVGPAEVESALIGHPAVVEAAVIGAPHPIKGESLVLFRGIERGP